MSELKSLLDRLKDADPTLWESIIDYPIRKPIELLLDESLSGLQCVNNLVTHLVIAEIYKHGWMFNTGTHTLKDGTERKDVTIFTDERDENGHMIAYRTGYLRSTHGEALLAAYIAAITKTPEEIVEED